MKHCTIIERAHMFSYKSVYIIGLRNKYLKKPIYFLRHKEHGFRPVQRGVINGPVR